MARTKQTARKEVIAQLKYQQLLKADKKRELEEEKLNNELKKDLDQPTINNSLKRLKKSSDEGTPAVLKILSDGSYVAFTIIQEEAHFDDMPALSPYVEEPPKKERELKIKEVRGRRIIYEEAEEVLPALISDEGESEPSDGESVRSEDEEAGRCHDCRCKYFPDCCYEDSDGEPADACDTCIDGACGNHKWKLNRDLDSSKEEEDDSSDSFVVPDDVCD